MRGKTSEIWNAGTVEVLKLMWGKGKSARLIAAALESLTNLPVTRDAVIGKAHRLGLPRHKWAPTRTHTHNSRRTA